MGSINVMKEYQDYYNLGPEGSTTTGLVFSIFQIGQMTGALFAWLADWRGRKFVIVFGCIGVVIGAIFTALAPTLPCFIGARFLLSFCTTLTMTAAPLLLVEIAPPLYRGTVAGLFNTLYCLGSIIATFSESPICFLYITDSRQLTNGSNIRMPATRVRQSEMATATLDADPMSRYRMYRRLVATRKPSMAHCKGS